MAPPITLGRGTSNAVQLHDTEISREHAEFRRRGTAFILRDLDSSNGTFVNGQPIQEHELASGDQVQLGRTLLLYTGVTEGRVEDLADKINIVSRQEEEDGSRIVHSMHQSEGSEFSRCRPITRSSSPWLARARSNLQIMYRTALAVSHTLDIDQLLARIMEMIFEWVDADRGCIMLKDVETGQLVPKVRRHRSGAAFRTSGSRSARRFWITWSIATKACSRAMPATTTAGTPRKAFCGWACARRSACRCRADTTWWA